MSTFRVKCPTCGPVEVPADRLELVAEPGRPVDAREASYGFTCTTCGRYAQRPVDVTTAAKLMLHGVVVRAPIRHPEDPPAGPALTTDDLLDLHLLLQEDGWFDRLVEAQPRG